jgi:DNA-binding CsgD family transcriptional regulator/PAS domain-containing protein
MKSTINVLVAEIESLREKLKYTEEILNHAPCLIYINEVGYGGQEQSMRNVYLNSYAIDQTGCTREEADALGSEYFRNVMHPDDFEVIDQSIEHLKGIQSDEVFGGIYKFKSKNGDYRWHIGRCKVFRRNPDGSPRQFINAGIELQNLFHTHNQVIELLKENKRLLNEIITLKLSKREKEVLKHLANGHCAKKIASLLHISESTVITHRKSLLKKLNMHNTASLVCFAVENGLN